MAQILLYYLILQSNLIQQSHILNSVKNSIVWSRFTFSSYINSSIYSTLSQILLYQLSYLVLHSHLFQQSHLFNIVTNSVVYLFCIHISFNSPNICKSFKIHLSYPIPHSNHIQQSIILNSVTNSIVWSRLHSHLVQQFHLFNSSQIH